MTKTEKTPQQIQRSWLEYMATRPLAKAIDFDNGTFELRLKLPRRDEFETFFIFTDAERLAAAYPKLLERADDESLSEDEVTMQAWWFLKEYLNESIEVNPISHYWVLREDGEGYEPDLSKPIRPIKTPNLSDIARGGGVRFGPVSDD